MYNTGRDLVFALSDTTLGLFGGVPFGVLWAASVAPDGLRRKLCELETKAAAEVVP